MDSEATASLIRLLGLVCSCGTFSIGGKDHRIMLIKKLESDGHTMNCMPLPHRRAQQKEQVATQFQLSRGHGRGLRQKLKAMQFKLVQVSNGSGTHDVYEHVTQLRLHPSAGLSAKHAGLLRKAPKQGSPKLCCRCRVLSIAVSCNVHTMSPARISCA